jgi:hypothetical protein
MTELRALFLSSAWLVQLLVTPEQPRRRATSVGT